MPNEREAMTLNRVLREMREELASNPPAVELSTSALRRWADAIDSYLSQQQDALAQARWNGYERGCTERKLRAAEPLGYANHNDIKAAIDGFICHRKGDQCFFTIPIYTRPSEDARDAVRMSWLERYAAKHGQHIWDALELDGPNLRSSIDAAMAKENDSV